MEFKVKEVKAVEEKSTQEIEADLLEKHEEQFEETTTEETSNEETTEEVVAEEGVATEEATEIAKEIGEDDVLTYMKNKYGRDFESTEKFLEKETISEELPEDVAAYMKYKKETGRGFDDYAKLSQDLDKLDPEALLFSYYKTNTVGLDTEDIADMMESEFGYDEDVDSDSQIKSKKIAKKQALAKAKLHFESEKDKYRVPLESSGSSLSEADTKALSDYKQYMESASSYEEEISRKNEWFQKKTSEVFNDEFKGFGFNLGEDEVLFNPSNAEELKTTQSNVQDFISKFLDKDGLMSDAKGYHKAIAVAMNPDKFAKFFYEQGKSEAVEKSARDSKNINMDSRPKPQTSNSSSSKVRSLDTDSGRGLKIRSKKNR